MTLEELEENEDEFGEDDEAAIEMYRWVQMCLVYGATPNHVYHINLCEEPQINVEFAALGELCNWYTMCFLPQTEASGGVEGDSDKERVRRSDGNLRAGLREGGQQGRRRHLGGAAPLQAGVGR